jgi:hypothetical protein
MIRLPVGSLEAIILGTAEDTRNASSNFCRTLACPVVCLQQSFPNRLFAASVSGKQFEWPSNRLGTRAWRSLSLFFALTQLCH